MPVAMNIVTDGRGCINRRPGISFHSNAYSEVIDSNGVDKIHVTNKGAIYAVGSSSSNFRNIYKVTSGGSSDISGGESSRMLVGTNRVIVAETEALLVFAGGKYLQKVVLDTNVSSRLGGTPPDSTHIVGNSQRLLSNDITVDRTKVRYSGTAIGTSDYSGHETWTFAGVGLSGFFTAEARPDPIQAIAENTNEVFVFGTTNLQIYTPDVQYAFSPVSTIESGLIAPYSVIKSDQNFAWLDHHKRFVISDGRKVQDISDPIGATIGGISDVSDCFGYRVVEDPVDCYVWTFPTDGRTFVYQVGVGWGQWQGYDWTHNNWCQLPVTCHEHDKTRDVNFVGTSNGYIGHFDSSSESDFDDQINAYVETGYDNRGTDSRKFCKAVRIALRRGEVSGTTRPVGFLQYSDAPGEWSEPFYVDFGISGDTNPVVSFRGLGTYRRRAWRFTFSGSVNLALVSVIEEYEVLKS